MMNGPETWNCLVSPGNPVSLSSPETEKGPLYFDGSNGKVFPSPPGYCGKMIWITHRQRALASEVVSVKAFQNITDDQLLRMKELTDQCQRVICSLNMNDMSGAAAPMRKIAEYARKREKLFH